MEEQTPTGGLSVRAKFAALAPEDFREEVSRLQNATDRLVKETCGIVEDGLVKPHEGIRAIAGVYDALFGVSEQNWPWRSGNEPTTDVQRDLLARASSTTH